DDRRHRGAVRVLLDSGHSDAEMNLAANGAKLFSPVVDELMLGIDVVTRPVRQPAVVEDESLAVGSELAQPVPGTSFEDGIRKTVRPEQTHRTRLNHSGLRSDATLFSVLALQDHKSDVCAPKEVSQDKPSRASPDYADYGTRLAHKVPRSQSLSKVLVPSRSSGTSARPQ